MLAKDAKETLRPVLRPGESLIWSDRPTVEAAMMSYSRIRGLVSFDVVLAVVALLGLLGPQLGLPGTELIDGLLAQAPVLPYVLGVFLVLPIALRALKLDTRSRYRRYFEGLTYGITDQRVIVIERNDVLSFAGNELDQPRVVERATGYGDVIFGRRRMATSNGSEASDPIRRERTSVGFKALRNAEEVKLHLEQWIASTLERAADAVSGYLEALETGSHSESAVPPGVARIRHPSTGLTLEYPDRWYVRVRKKKKPFGKTFLDVEHWKAPNESEDWNLVRIEGAGGCSVDAEVFETPVLASYDTLANGPLASLTGELMDSDPAYQQHGMQGFVVTRRSEDQANPTTDTMGAASVVTPFRTTILHDGQHQVCLMSKWPERSTELSAAVDAVVRSARIA